MMSRTKTTLRPVSDADIEEVIDRLDPDVRFLLANERTLLAWVRTALTLIAGGVALTHFASSASRSTTVTGIAVVLLGAVMSVIGYVRYKIADGAIRSGKLPDIGRGPLLQVTSVLAFSAILIVLQLTSN